MQLALAHTSGEGKQSTKGAHGKLSAEVTPVSPAPLLCPAPAAPAGTQLGQDLPTEKKNEDF